MDRALGVFLLFLAGIAIGAGGMRMWEWLDYTRALESERSAIGERDKLVRELAEAKGQRDKAQAQAKRERQAIYANDVDAATWARQPVPRAIAERMQRNTGTSDGATSATSANRLP